MRASSILLFLFACKGTVTPTGDGPTETDATPVPTPVETECDDGVDDDEDGDVDCYDSDCEAETYCSWPIEGIAYTVRFAYDASDLAIFAGYNDCAIEGTSFLERDRDESCDGCDRVYCGDFTIDSDDCPSEFDRPDRVCYGFAFTSDTSWDVWYEDEESASYENLGTATESTTAIGTLEMQNTEQVVVEGINGGNIQGSFTFTPDPASM